MTTGQPFDLEQVLDDADAWWTSCARAALEYAAAAGEPFDAYTLTELGVPDPDHPARWGALFRVAAYEGLIRAAGYAPSRRPGVNGSIVRVWVGAQARSAA